MTARFSIPDFSLANPIYAGGRVNIYTIDVNGVRTDTLATLYAATTGTTTLRNPQRLDGFGKFAQPVYVDQPVVAVVTGLTIPDHETGVIRSLVGTPSWRGAVAYPTADVVSPSYPYTVALDAETADTDLIHDLVTNNSRLTVPSGATKVRLRGRVTWKPAAIDADAGTALTIYKNGSASYTGIGLATAGKAFYGNPTIECTTVVLNVVGGDYFELVADTSDATADILAASTWFEMEIIE